MLIANLLLALREGFEATLIVGILFAYLKKAGRQDVYPKLWLGIGLAALVPLSFGAILTWGQKHSPSRHKRSSAEDSPSSPWPL